MDVVEYSMNVIVLVEVENKKVTEKVSKVLVEVVVVT